MVKNSDLHTHSYYSDGFSSPAEVVRKAKENGIKNLALTDHNSIQGIIEAQKEAKKQKINLIPGIELRCKEGEVLGYFIDFKDKEFIRKVKIIQDRSKEVFENAIKELNKRGIDVRSNEILDTKLKKDNVLIAYLFSFLREKNKISIQEMKDFMKGDLFEPSFSTEEVIKMINDAGGISVLAHPWHSKTFLEENRIKELVKAGLKGIEVDNREVKDEERTNLFEKTYKLAEKYKLILTSGSDYHGDPSSRSDKHKIGVSNCDEDVVERLEELSKLA